MANPYNSASISSYNSNPPPDDGTQVTANEITWAKHKTKLADPIKTLAETINTNVSNAFGKIFGNSVSTQATSFTVATSNQGQLIYTTNAITATLPDPANVGSNFCFAIFNTDTSNTLTLGRNGNNINGVASDLSLLGGSWAILYSDGSDWWALGASGAPGVFTKTDPTIVLFTKTGAGTAETQTELKAEVNGTILAVASGTSLTMPTLTAGTDYAVWLETDGTLQVDSSHSTPPSANARKIGGFHYAPGGNATGTSGGNTTSAINEYSFWDLKFRPACPDPRGMTLVADSFWSSIYLLGVDHITNGPSAYNVSIADGSAPPKIPTMFGGNGTSAYSNGNWWNIAEALQSHGLRLPTYDEFAALAYGTTEATSSGGSDVPTTGVDGTGATSGWETFTSKWGVIQSSGCIYTWGNEFGGGAASAAWTANTGGRGSTYQMENAVLFGGSWGGTTVSGSRCSGWSNSPTSSSGNFGGRGVCDHLVEK